MPDALVEHWDKIGFFVTVVLFFVMWRNEANRNAEAQKVRDEAILSAVRDVVNVVRESRSQAAEEHAGLAKLFERLDEHTVNEHRALEKALERLTTSMDHHIAEERIKG